MVLEPTDNHNKILVLDRAADQLIACGTVKQGICGKYKAADISATQSAKFLDLLWSAAMGWLLFADLPSGSTLLGGVVIATATLWVARREGQRRSASSTPV